MLPTMLLLIPVLGQSSAANLSGPWASSSALIIARRADCNLFRTDQAVSSNIILGSCNRDKNPFVLLQSAKGHDMSTTITICDTCKIEGWDAETAGLTDGEALAALIEAEVAATGAAVKTRRFSCLMGCNRACNITIQATDKLSYTLGDFAADADAAKGIVEYAILHDNSASGQVPYREWPQAIKGHFTTRHPPLDNAE